MIKRIYKFENQMVVVFDEFGNQLPEYQGWVGDVAHKLESSLSKTDFNRLKFNPITEIVI